MASRSMPSFSLSCTQHLRRFIEPLAHGAHPRARPSSLPKPFQRLLLPSKVYTVSGPIGFSNIEHMGVIRIFRPPPSPTTAVGRARRRVPAAARPQSPRRGKSRGSIGGSDFEFGDGDVAGARRCSYSCAQPSRVQQYDTHVVLDPAERRKGHRSHFCRIGATLPPFDVGVRHRFVMRQRKHQCDIYIDAAGNELLYSRNSLGGRRNFNHHVGPTDRTVEPLGLGNRRLRVARKMGETSRLTYPSAPLVWS